MAAAQCQRRSVLDHRASRIAEELATPMCLSRKIPRAVQKAEGHCPVHFDMSQEGRQAPMENARVGRQLRAILDCLRHIPQDCFVGSFMRQECIATFASAIRQKYRGPSSRWNGPYAASA
jgi:hypothetical protein